jgi:hypothetical protein
MKAPCKDCPDRHLHCHSECERYKTFKQECDELREKRNKIKQAEYTIDRIRYAKAYKIKQKQKTKYWH